MAMEIAILPFIEILERHRNEVTCGFGWLRTRAPELINKLGALQEPNARIDEKLLCDIYDLEEMIDILQVAKEQLRQKLFFRIRTRKLFARPLQTHQFFTLRQRIAELMSKVEKLVSTDGKEAAHVDVSSTTVKVSVPVSPRKPSRDPQGIQLATDDVQATTESSSQVAIVRTVSLSTSEEVSVSLSPIKSSCHSEDVHTTYSKDKQVPANIMRAESSVNNVLDFQYTENLQDSSRLSSADYLDGKSHTNVLENLVNRSAEPLLNLRTLQLFVFKAYVRISGNAILLWAVYNSEVIKQCFQCRAWVCVSEDFEDSHCSSILNDILEQVTGVKRKGELPPLKSLQERLCDVLVWRRYLIVLYGNQLAHAWEHLKYALPYSLNGSRVILAVLDTDIANQTNSMELGRDGACDDQSALPNASDEGSLQQFQNSSENFLDESSITCLKTIAIELAELILNPRRLLFLISIVDVVGTGKTSLLWLLYNAEDVKLRFQCRAWIHVSEDFDEKDVLIGIFQQVAGVKLQRRKRSLESLRQMVRRFLAQKRYLIVLYDVWSADVWKAIKLCLPNSFNDSRVILTVHEADVAQQTDSWLFAKTFGRGLFRNFGTRENILDLKVAGAQRWDRQDITDKESEIVGMKDTIEELAELLLNSFRLQYVISVLGDAGTGKTAIVRTIYKSLAIKEHFKCRAWVPVSQDFDARKILVDLSRQLRGVEEDSLPLDQLEKRLGLYLLWKRYLIVLDDVRAPDVWKNLSRVLQNSSNGSRVILTTREGRVAHHIYPQTALRLSPLSKDESWRLFLKKVKKTDDENNGQLLGFKEKILRKCDGLPLSIAVLGGLLSTKEYTEWSSLIEQTNRKKVKRKGLTDEDRLNSLGPLPISGAKQKNERKEVGQASSEGKRNDVADQSVSLARAGSIRKAKNRLTEQPAFGGDQHNCVMQQGPEEIKQTGKKKGNVILMDNVTSYEDQEDPSKLLASSEIKEENESVTFVENHLHSSTDQLDGAFAEIQSHSSGEVALLDDMNMSLPDSLAASYSVLQAPLKRCFLYLSLFRQTDRIPVRRILQLWLAEELVTRPESERSVQEQVHGYFEELENIQLIEIVKRQLDGSPKKIRIKSEQHVEALSANAEKIGFFHIHRKQSSGTTNSLPIRRLAELDVRSNTSKEIERHIQKLRSYISVSFDTRKGDAPATGVDKLLQKIVRKGFGLLRVLDLEGVYKPVLSDTLSKLPLLKYLGLRSTFLDSVPESVGDLPNLETLDVKHTDIPTLPSSIWKAKNLQHLYLNGIYVDMSTLTGSSADRESSSSLQTLTGLVIKDKCPEENRFARFTALRKLGLTCHKNKVEETAKWVSKLTNLQSLKWRSVDDNYSKPADLKLAVTDKHENLLQLYLLGKLPTQIDDIRKLPQKLRILTLSVSELHTDPMGVLGQLKKLHALGLYARSYTGTEMNCHKDHFPELRVLRLWMLEELEKWIIEEGTMRQLTKLEIRCCKKLDKNVTLEKLTNLQKLILTNMEKGFEDDVKKRISSRVFVKPKQLAFPSPWGNNDSLEGVANVTMQSS